MKFERRISSHSYAEFTLSRLPKSIKDSLTDEQYMAVKQALIAQDRPSRHRIDVRINVPLFFRQYYFLLLGGRDRRVATYRLENSRFNKIPLPIRKAIHFFISIILTISLVSIFFMLIYNIKTLLGFDILSDFHLSDLMVLIERE